MSFAALYRASFYVMLFLATLTLSVDAAADNPFATLHPIAVATGGILAFVTVDRNPKLGLTRSFANLLAFAAISLSYLEYRVDSNFLLIALAHWLVYLQLIKMFLPKTEEDDWFLFLIGLVQVLVGAVLSQSDTVGMLMMLWALTSLWVLRLFHLYRESCLPWETPGTRVTPAPIKGVPYPGLMDGSFGFSSMRVGMTTLALGGIIFLCMPRAEVMGRTFKRIGLGPTLTGFDTEVKLGQMGEILENDTIVMTVEFQDEADRRIDPPQELLWRGTTMAVYDRGRWRRQPSSPLARFRISGGLRIPAKPSDGPMIRQKIKLEASNNDVLFSLRPVYRAQGERRNPPLLNDLDGTIGRDLAGGALDYDVVSGLDTSRPQVGETNPDSRRLRYYLSGLENPRLRARLRELAESRLSQIPTNDFAARARNLESFLRDSGEFGYSLKQQVVDPSLDPVEDFLFNRKEGHCEYYASALALMLRSVGIPTRVVNGFKGGDWNVAGRVLNVRQKHAHSWVEALMNPPVPGQTFRGEPIWLTLDPTPAGARDASVAQVGGFAGNFRQAFDFVRYLWVFYVVGFNAERQNRLIYEPARKLWSEAKRGFAMIGEGLRRAAQQLLHFPSVRSFFSLRGFGVTVLFLAIPIGLYRVGGRIRHWIRARWPGGASDEAARSAGVLFYRRLLTTLARAGLERPAAETPREFGTRAAQVLSGRGTALAAVADVPDMVIDAFYRVRFGRRELGPDDLDRLETRLDALDAALRASAG